ncbi:MAG TPA: phytanoyl-CoA dioxygenase family protein [Pyrinomonadaceae bacterium]|nr:phytanoyl-CoA dioxygenase family protein [Pyrinomonadaceae bacterium]
MPARYDCTQIKQFAESVITDGFCVLPKHFSPEKLDRWRQSFLPLLERHVSREGHRKNRGPSRYYVTLPFTDPFADPCIYEEDDVLAIVEELVGTDAVMCQLAADTPLLGSTTQDIHRDALPLFPETGQETPPFQLAVNFPLVEITMENGPLEVARQTHMVSKQEGLRRLESGEVTLEPIAMKVGDVMIRDVRGLHRGTPNRTQEPRPMVVIGYSRRWLFRPEVSIHIPRPAFDNLSSRARHLLRFNPIVESLDDVPEAERYQSFAY